MNIKIKIIQWSPVPFVQFNIVCDASSSIFTSDDNIRISLKLYKNEEYDENNNNLPAILYHRSETFGTRTVVVAIEDLRDYIYIVKVFNCNPHYPIGGDFIKKYIGTLNGYFDSDLDSESESDLSIHPILGTTIPPRPSPPPLLPLPLDPNEPEEIPEPSPLHQPQPLHYFDPNIFGINQVVSSLSTMTTGGPQPEIIESELTSNAERWVNFCLLGCEEFSHHLRINRNMHINKLTQTLLILGAQQKYISDIRYSVMDKTMYVVTRPLSQ
jgi:hypothetical protein